MMTRPRLRWMLSLTFVLLTAIATRPVAAAPETARAGDVKVTVKYTGKGTVDASHRLWVWLFDTPEIGPGAIPISEMSIDKNGGTASFTNVAVGKVWVAIAFDVAGGFAGAAPPPSGSPATLYMEKGVPTPVTPGPDVAITVVFDDTQKMP